MDIEKQRAIIVPTTHPTTDPNLPSTALSNKPLGSATRFDWKNKQQQLPKFPESESRSCQIRRNSLSQRNLSVRTKLCYRMADLVMVMCLLFPLAIAFWRGVWQLMDYHSNKWGVDPWLSMAVGYLIPFVLYLLQEPLKRTVCLEKMSFPLFYFLSRTILLIHSFGSVNQWRGLWVWMDRDLGVEWVSAVSMMLVGIGFSICFKTLNNILAPPLFCVVDEAKSIHDCPLRFKTTPEKPLQYFLDCFFSVIIIPGFVVFCWRGLWTLADIYLYPESETNSAIASLCLGYAICILLCLAQPSISKRVRNLKGLVRLAFIDSICIFGFVGCVLAWRGVWNSYNIFLVFETVTLSEWITTLVGAFGTMIFGCISIVVVRGIAIDGDLVEDGSADWLIPYISSINTPVYDVPFPEPWVCRYFCTSQKIIWKRRRRQEGKDMLDPFASSDGNIKPLKIANVLSNSVHPATTDTTEVFLNKNSANNRFRLSDLPNIDSSSEEELGMRTKMVPPPDEDVINANTQNNNGADVEGQQQRQSIC